jgi:succinate dehydrogenase/fumarate reductase cytochrome b subunit
MIRVTLASVLFFSLPLITSAAETLQSFLPNFLKFLNDIVIPFLIGIAFLFFIINAIRFFVVGSSSEEGREKAKSLAIYGIAAVVFIIIFWGIVNMLTTSFGLDGCTQPLSDYYLETSTGLSLPSC